MPDRFRLGRAGLLVLALLGATPAFAAPLLTPQTVDARVDAIRRAMIVSPAQALEEARAAEPAFAGLTAADRPMALAKLDWLEAESLLRLNRLEDARGKIDAGLQRIAKARPSKVLGDLLIARGGYHMASADVAAALDDYQRAHNIFHEVGETRSQAIALVDIGVLYQEAKDNPNALKYFSQALDAYRDDPMLLYTVYNNRGDALKELGRYREAETDLFRALKIARALKSADLTSLVLRNIARTQLLAGELGQADRTIAEGFRAISSSVHDESAQMLWAMAAQAALQHGRTDQARALIGRSFAGVNLATTPVQFRANHQTAYDIYSKTGDAALALSHLQALKRLDDETLKLAASINTALAGARFDYANQELRIAKLKADDLQRKVAYERARARSQRMIFLSAAAVTTGVFLLLGFGLVTIRRSRNQVRTANIGLAESNTALGKALAAKTEFLATTSHEIRTPLNGILGMTQVMLADPGLAADVRDRVGVVHGAGVTMRALVDDILDVAKMESGKLTIEEVPFDLRATLIDASRLWQEQARTRGLGFDLVLDDLPERIEGDPARVRQIVFNLLSNAMKFTEEGCIRLSGARDGERIRITVSDSGIGIPADKLELIFESFRQADAGTTRKFGGTGLGLAICRNLARAMDGDILVASGSTGSTFTLELPYRPAAELAAAARGQGGLLIVDPNPISRSLLKAVLAPRAGEVTCVADLSAALDAISERGFEAVVVDEAALVGTSDADLARLRSAARGDGARLALLTKSDPVIAADLVIIKPIAGAALAERLYPTIASGTAHLATRAA